MHVVRRRLAADGGGVLALVALFLFFVSVPLMALVIDYGKFFQHKKHLQLQVDAGALAGGAKFKFPCTAATESDVEAEARRYAGDPSVAGAYNTQVAPTKPADLHLLLNSTAFWNAGGTNYSDGRPCAKLYVDVKGTDAALPWYFGLVGKVLSPLDVNAEARVAISQANALGGLLPIGVRDVDVKTAAVLFVDDANPAGSPLRAKFLTKTGLSGGLSNWSNAADKASVTMPSSSKRVSAVILLSSRESGVSLSGTTATICNQAQVDCYYDEGGATFTPSTGLAFVRGYATTPTCCTTAIPQVRAVRFVSGGTCANPYFVYRPSAACSVRVRVTMDYGTIAASRITLKAQTTAECPKNLNNPNASAVTGNTEWQQDVTGITADAGPVGIYLCTEVRDNGPGAAPVINGQTCTNSNPCSYALEGSGTTAGLVHQVVSGNDDTSGPVRGLTIWNGDTSGSECYWATCTGTRYANAFQQGSTHLLYVTLQIAGALTTSASDPPIALRVAKDASDGGSGNQVAIDCEQGVNLETEIAVGCKPTYGLNTRLTQPDPCDPPYGTKSTDLWNVANPPAIWECVAVKPGGTIGQFSNGISTRVYGTSKPPGSCPGVGARGHNNWDVFPNFPDGDPRIIQLFMVPFGAFRDTGKDQIFPVVNFGAFYVRGWGGTRDDPCNGSDVPNAQKGYLYGNFIKYIIPSGAGTGGGAPCDPTAFAPCLPVLVK